MRAPGLIAAILCVPAVACGTHWNRAAWPPGRRPVAVHLAPHLDPCWVEATREAIDGINAVVGGDLLHAVLDDANRAVPATGEILVTQGPLGASDACPDNWSCETIGRAGPAMMFGRSIVAAKVVLTDHTEHCSTRAAAHELGHALGVGHQDSDPSAMMAPYAAPGDGRWLPMSVDHMRRSL